MLSNTHRIDWARVANHKTKSLVSVANRKAKPSVNEVNTFEIQAGRIRILLPDSICFAGSASNILRQLVKQRPKLW